MTKSKLNLLFPIICLILCLLFPAASTVGVRRGLSVSLENALPALYPALVLASLLTKSQKTEKTGVLTPFFVGLCCGFPVGAATVSSMVTRGLISKKDGEKLLFFCNNAGAAFLISYCGKTVLKDVRKGIFLFLLQSTLSLSCLFFFFGKRLFYGDKKDEKSSEYVPFFWKKLPDALGESANSFIYIISCIIFFSFFTELIRHIFSLKGTSLALFGILVELCGGLKLLDQITPSLAFPLCALGCGWGGISVHLQTAGVLEKSGLSTKSFFLGKIFFSAIMFTATLFLQKLL